MQDAIDIRAIFGLLRRHLRIIIASVALIVGAAALITLTMTPVYTATTLIMVDTSNKNLLSPESDFSSASGDNARVDGEVELARSDNVLLSAIDKENLVNDPEFRSELSFTTRVLAFLRIREPVLPTPEQALRQTLNKLAGMVSVQRRGLTYLISINARSTNPAKAAQLANAVADAYIENQLQSKVNSALQSRDVLQSQIGAARQAIVNSEGAFDQFLNTNLPRIVQETGNNEIRTLQQRLQNLNAERQSNLANVDALQASLAQEDYSSLAARLADESFNQLEQQRQELLGQIQNEQSAPQVEGLRTRLADLESQLNTNVRGQISELRGAVDTAQQEETDLRRQIRSSILDSDLSADVLTQIFDLQQGAELARTQYENLLARSQDLETQAALQLADSRVVSPALSPNAPSWPNTRLILLLSALVALAVGIGLAFLYENFIGGITTEEQATGILRTKIASVVPRQKIVGQESRSLSDTIVAAPLSLFSESIRRIRAALDQSLRHDVSAANGDAPVIMITSTAPNEGKTTLSMSIARSYALSGQRVLLIDCDLRKPSVHRQLGLEPSHGLIDLLAAPDMEVQLRDSLVNDPLTGLTVIVGSRRSGLPTDQLIAGKSFKRLIDSARKTFDVVILDTPPLGPVVDGIYLARHASAVVYVVRWASTPQADVKKAVATLMESKPESTEVLAVLNQQEMSNSAYYSKYGSYYTETA